MLLVVEEKDMSVHRKKCAWPDFDLCLSTCSSCKCYRSLLDLEITHLNHMPQNHYDYQLIGEIGGFREYCQIYLGCEFTSKQPYTVFPKINNSSVFFYKIVQYVQ